MCEWREAAHSCEGESWRARSGLRVGASSCSSRGPGWGCEATPRLSTRGCGGTARIGSKSQRLRLGHRALVGEKGPWGGLLLPHPWACPLPLTRGKSGPGEKAGCASAPSPSATFLCTGWSCKHLLSRLGCASDGEAMAPGLMSPGHSAASGPSHCGFCLPDFGPWRAPGLSACPS